MEENELEVTEEVVSEETAEETPENETATRADVVSAAVRATKPYTFGADILDWFDTVIYSVLAIVVIFTFCTRMSTVDGTSMYPTLDDKQNLMIENMFYTPAHNDIVVVWSERIPNEEGGRGKALVKRVIGVPGDTISIDYTHGTVTRNGEQLPLEVKDGVLYEDGHIINEYTHDEEGLGGEFTVPEEMIFVMGDNRNASTDSRSYMVGYIDIRNVVGKAYWRVTPFDKFGSL